MRRVIVDRTTFATWYAVSVNGTTRVWDWTRLIGDATVFQSEEAFAVAFLLLEDNSSEVSGELDWVDLDRSEHVS